MAGSTRASFAPRGWSIRTDASPGPGRRSRPTATRPRSSRRSRRNSQRAYRPDANPAVVSPLRCAEAKAATTHSEIAAQTARAQGRDEYVSERTRDVRERPHGGANAGMARMNGEEMEASLVGGDE